jgi:hypothetical protein
MASEPNVITDEEFASLLALGRCSMLQPPAVIPGEHRARLIWLGYIADIGGRLRTTTSGRRRIAADFFLKTCQCPQRSRMTRLSMSANTRLGTHTLNQA